MSWYCSDDHGVNDCGVSRFGLCGPIKVRREIVRSAETRPAETSFTTPRSSGFAHGTTSLAAYGAARSGRCQPRRKTAPHDSRPGPTRCLQPITFALRLLALVVTECTAASLPLPFPPFCFLLGIKNETARVTVTPPLAVAPLAHGDDMRWNPNLTPLALRYNSSMRPQHRSRITHPIQEPITKFRLFSEPITKSCLSPLPITKFRLSCE